MKCPTCKSESVSKVNPWIDHGTAAATGAVVGTVVPIIGTLIGTFMAASISMANSRHHTLQIYHKCGGCGRKF